MNKTTRSFQNAVILSVEITGGFLKGVKFEIHKGFNTIIGGRGTGKTTVHELIRFALGLNPDKTLSTARAKAFEKLIAANLANGCVRVCFQARHGARFTVERVAGEAPVFFDENGVAVQISQERGPLFKADIYSQAEIEEIADEAPLKLALLDRFAEEELRAVGESIKAVLRQLEPSAAELLRLERERCELAAVLGDAEFVGRQLAALEQAGTPDSARLNRAHRQKALRDMEARDVTARCDDMRWYAEAVRRLAAHPEVEVDADILAGPNGDIFQELHTLLREFRSEIEKGAAELGASCETALADVGGLSKKVFASHAAQGRDYRALVEQSNEEVERATERARLQAQALDIESARKRLEECERSRGEVGRGRRKLLDRLVAHRARRGAIRSDVAQRLSEKLKSAGVIIAIEQQADSAAYREKLREALTGMETKTAAVAAVARISPQELARLVYADDAVSLAERLDVETNRACSIAERIKASELVFEIETIERGDVARIGLMDGGKAKDCAELSTGQKCTAILPILLLESDRPLLLDQPEDHLDNAWICRSVVDSIRLVRGKRQLIFVTHNPNIPVLGGAERVFVMASDGTTGSVRAGSIDEMKGDIEDILEGGRDAFLERKARYGH